MGAYIETEYITHHRLYLLYSGVAELENMFTILADKVIMLLVGIRPFEQSQIPCRIDDG